MNHLKRNSTKSFKDSVKSFDTAMLPDITYFNTNDFVGLTYDCTETNDTDPIIPIGYKSIGMNDVDVRSISFIFGSSATNKIFRRYKGNFKIILDEPFMMTETVKGSYYKVLKLKTLIKKLILKPSCNDRI